MAIIDIQRNSDFIQLLLKNKPTKRTCQHRLRPQKYIIMYTNTKMVEDSDSPVLRLFRLCDLDLLQIVMGSSSAHATPFNQVS